MTHTDAERGTTWYPKLLPVVIFMTETSLVAPQCSWRRTSQFGAADGCETSHHVQSERNLQEEATRLWDTYGINMELYCISPSTLAALLLYDHTLNHLLPSKQLPPEQPPLLFKIHSAHILHNTFEHQEASFQQISKKFLYCDTTYQNKPTEEKKIKFKIIIIKKDKSTSARLVNRQECRRKPAQSCCEREDLPMLVFSLTAPCLQAIMDGGNSSGTKSETQKEGNLYGRLKRQNLEDLWTDIYWETENVLPHLQSTSESLPHSGQSQKPAGPHGFLGRWTEQVKCPQSSAAGDRDTQAWTTTWLLPNPAMMGLLAACATSARQPLNRAAASGALQRSRHMAGHSVL